MAFSDEEIREFEDSYEIEFPKLIITFLKTYTTGKKKEKSWEAGEKIIERFLTLDESDDVDDYEMNYVLSLVFDRITEDGDSHRMPIIPIAALFGGDLLCLDFRTGTNPSIVVWDHEASDTWKPVTHKLFNDIAQLEKAMVVID